jgi:hypothetical protein
MATIITMTATMPILTKRLVQLKDAYVATLPRGDLLEYVEATQWRRKKPGITCVPQRTFLAGRPLIATNYEDVSTLTIKDQRWICCLKEVIFTKSLECKPNGWNQVASLASYMHINAGPPPPKPSTPLCDKRFIADLQYATF